MIIIEIVALGLMLWVLWLTWGLWGRARASGQPREYALPILLYLVTAAILGLAAFGGDSGLVTDWRTMLARGLGLAVIGGVVAAYALVLRRIRRSAADRDGSGGT